MSKIVKDLTDLVKEASRESSIASDLEKNFQKNWDNPEEFHEAEWGRIKKIKPSSLVPGKS